MAGMTEAGDGTHLGAAHSKRRRNSQSCSQKEVQSSRSGPWSVEWLRNIQQGDVSLISSKKKRLKRTLKGGEGNSKVHTLHASRKKTGVGEG